MDGVHVADRIVCLHHVDSTTGTRLQSPRHGLAVQAIRASAGHGVKVGPAEVIQCAVPMIETPEHIAAAEAATRELNAAYLTVIAEGRYTEGYLSAAGQDAPHFTDDDLSVISSPMDFMGINVYKPAYCAMASDTAPGWRAIPFAKAHPRMFNSWLALAPEAIYWASRVVQSLWAAPEIFITENGCASDDEVALAGHIYDTDRVAFLRSFLPQRQRATADGIPVKGYFHWSMMDNFEWMAGYGNPFGMVHVDVDTLARTPKLSAQWFRQAAAHNRVV